MLSSPVTAGADFVKASQYNNLLADAKIAAHLLPHQQSSPNNTLKIEAGLARFTDTTFVVYVGGNSGVFSAPSTNPRIDNVSIDSSGTIVITAGTENAAPTTTKGLTPAGNIPICEVYCRVGGSNVTTVDNSTDHFIYRDIRPILSINTLTKVGTGGAADFLNSTYFQQDGSNHIRPSTQLMALSDLSSTGIIARTGAGTVAARTFQGTTNKIVVTNGDGVSGNPVFNIGSDIVTLTDAQVLTNKTVNDTTFTVQNASDTSKKAQFSASSISAGQTRTFTFPNASGTIALTSDLSSGYQPLDDDLTALAAVSSTGILTRTGAGTASARTLTGTSNRITITNGDGVSGNPTFDVGSTVVVTTGTYSDPSWLTALAGSKISGNISGNAANVTGTVAIANGGTGQTTANTAFNALAPSQSSNSGKVLKTDGTNTAWSNSLTSFSLITPTTTNAAETTQTLTDGASIAWDMNSGAVATVTLGGNRTMAAPSNTRAGAKYTLLIIQDGTGSRTLAYNAVFKFPNNIAPVLQTAAASVDVLTFISDGTNLYMISSASGSATSVIKTFDCGETINGATLPVPVYQSSADGKIYACDGDDETKLNFFGFAVSNGTSSSTISVQISGVIKGFSSLTIGTKYYVSDTLGVLGSSAGTYPIVVGTAVSTTEILMIRENTCSMLDTNVTRTDESATSGTKTGTFVVYTPRRARLIDFTLTLISNEQSGSNSTVVSTWKVTFDLIRQKLTRNTLTGLSNANITSPSLFVSGANLNTVDAVGMHVINPVETFGSSTFNIDSNGAKITSIVSTENAITFSYSITGNGARKASIALSTVKILG